MGRKVLLMMKAAQSFWVAWFVHAVIAFVVAWFVFGPIFELTFRNANLDITKPELIYLILVYLVGIWVLQLLTLRLYSTASKKIQWFIILGAYVQISPPVIAAVCLVRRWKIKTSWIRYMLIGLLVVIFWKILSEVMAAYLIIFTEIFFAFVK